MPILSGDIQLLAAERLLDTPDGGGRMTGQRIVDGQANNLFPDISELDRTYGRVSLRKCYPAVLTDSTESYYGSHVILDDGPDDPRVSVTLFSTRSWTDRRDAARDRIERYLARGPRLPGQLLEKQLSGQRAIQLLLKPGDALPRVGQTLVLVQDEAKPAEIEQYVRLTRITTTDREFAVTDAGGASRFRGVVATCEIADPLRYDFEGPPPTLRDDASARAVARDTVVANAATYYGLQPLVTAAQPGDVRIAVANLFGQLVPSAQAETALVDLTAAGQVAPLVDAGTRPVSFTTPVPFGPDRTLHLGSPCLPGSLRVVVGGTEITDRDGQLRSGDSVIGTLDYARGVLRGSAVSPPYPGTKTVSFRPAAAPLRVADTAAIAITPENRGYTYTITLVPPPRPGALLIAYLAQGQWYELRDTGTGAARGADSAFGTATVDYVSGTVVLTTGALPDANTEIVFAWGTAASQFNRSATVVPPPEVRHTAQHTGLVPGTLVLSWTDGAQTRQAQDDGHGVLTGDAQGTVRYTTGEIALTPERLPAGGAEIALSYQHGPPLEASFPHPLRDADGRIRVQLPHTDLRPGTVALTFNLLISNYEAVSLTPAELQYVQRIDPLKTARDVRITPVAGRFSDDVQGEIDYSTGQIVFRPDVTVTIPVARYRVERIGLHWDGSAWKPVYRNTFTHWQYIPAGASMPLDETGLVTVRYRAADSPQVASETIAVSRLAIDLTDRYAERIVPGSVRFTLGERTYLDRLGTLVADPDPATGAASAAGTIDYASGRAEISLWTPAALNRLNLESLVTELGAQPVDEVVFRVPAAPVRPGSLQLRAVPLTGGSVTATASADGTLATPAMQGRIDAQTGIVRVRFGRWVTAAGNETQIWFHPDAVVAGRIFQPLPVLADTIRFNAVAYSYLPLAADLLGLDPVRLPADGRVPLYRPGDVVVVHHTATLPFPANVTAGHTLDVGRVRLSALRVRDADRQLLPTTHYQSDLDAGTVTLATPLNLVGFREPLVAEHRIEDLALVSDAQINGVLTLTQPLTHAFPAGETRVSSALVIGDLQARAHTVFTQQTWTGEWADSRIGAGTTAQFNATLYPIGLTNRGAIEERWALIFTQATEFRVIGEASGQIALGNTATDLAPINPTTGVPYFVLRAAGWGAGWSAGNVLRFNTAGANFPVWIARTVRQGPASTTSDQFHLQIRGDIDR